MIQASVSPSQTGKPLAAAKPVAFTDMVQMPQAHASGPIPMKPLPGRPGVFAAKSAVPMPGDYKVTVRVKGPKSGTQTETVSVGTVQH